MIKEILKKSFDTIITEKDFEWNSIQEVLAYHLTKKNKQAKQADTIAILIEKLPLDPFFDQIINSWNKDKEYKKNITIIENTSYNKNLFKTQQAKISPFSLLDYNFEIFFPLDYKNFTEILKDKKNSNSNNNNNKNKYIIIDEEKLPEKLEEKKETGPITIDFDNNKDWEDTIMIFTLGTSYISVGQALNQITSKDFQLTICNSITEIKERILESEKRENYKKIIIALDHANTTILEKEIIAFLYKNSLSDKQITFITPNYEKPATFLEEYSDEEAEFNPENITKKIIEFIAMPT